MTDHFHLVQNPLIEHKLTYLRDKDRPPHEFSRLLREVGMLMALELSCELPREEKTVQTYLSPNGADYGNYSITGKIISGRKVVLVPILRAGLIMAEGLREVMPFARIGYLGLHQNETHSETIEYLVKLPEPAGRTFILIDPMIGTGNTACRAIKILEICHVPYDDIRFIGLLASEQGKQQLTSTYPQVRVYVAGVDAEVNNEGRVVPGVGIINERLFGV